MIGDFSLYLHIYLHKLTSEMQCSQECNCQNLKRQNNTKRLLRFGTENFLQGVASDRHMDRCKGWLFVKLFEHLFQAVPNFFSVVDLIFGKYSLH